MPTTSPLRPDGPGLGGLAFGPLQSCILAKGHDFRVSVFPCREVRPRRSHPDGARHTTREHGLARESSPHHTPTWRRAGLGSGTQHAVLRYCGAAMVVGVEAADGVADKGWGPAICLPVLSPCLAPTLGVGHICHLTCELEWWRGCYGASLDTDGSRQVVNGGGATCH